MELQPHKSIAPLVLGIISIVFGILIPIVGLICGIIGLVQALNGKKASANFALSLNEPKIIPYNYKLEIILNSVGIVIAVVIWIIGIFLYQHISGN